MTLNVSRLFVSDWSIGITGYASAVPEGNNKLFAYFAIDDRGKIKAKGQLQGNQTDPVTAQFQYTDSVLKKFSALL